MRHPGLILILIALLLGPSPQSASALVGGRELAADELSPSAVLIARNGRWGTCGGALVGTRLVMTAAHCVVDGRTGRPLPQGKVSVSAPTMRFDVFAPLPNLVAVERIIVSYASAPARYGNDLALLKLAAPVPGGVPGQVGRPKLRAGAPLSLVAWGPTNQTSLGTRSRFDDAGRARAARFPTRPARACTRVRAYRKVFEKATMVCAGRPARHHDTCPGDSGSPALYRGTIVAVVSFSLDTSCSGRRPPGPVILARPDAEFLALLRKEGARVEEPARPTPPVPARPTPLQPPVVASPGTTRCTETSTSTDSSASSSSAGGSSSSSSSSSSSTVTCESTSTTPAATETAAPRAATVSLLGRSPADGGPYRSDPFTFPDELVPWRLNIENTTGVQHDSIRAAVELDPRTGFGYDRANIERTRANGSSDPTTSVPTSDLTSGVGLPPLAPGDRLQVSFLVSVPQSTTCRDTPAGSRVAIPVHANVTLRHGPQPASGTLRVQCPY